MQFHHPYNLPTEPSGVRHVSERRPNFSIVPSKPGSANRNLRPACRSFRSLTSSGSENAGQPEAVHCHGMRWIVDLIYLVLAVVSSPIWLVRMTRTGKIRTDWRGRFGHTP